MFFFLWDWIMRLDSSYRNTAFIILGVILMLFIIVINGKRLDGDSLYYYKRYLKRWRTKGKHV